MGTTFSGIKTSLPTNNDWASQLSDFISLFDGTNQLTDTILLNPGGVAAGFQITGSIVISSSVPSAPSAAGTFGEIKIGHSGSMFQMYICSQSGGWYTASLGLMT